MNLPAIIIDVLVVIAGLSLIYKAYRRGFIRTLANTAGYVISCFVAYTGSRALAQACYKLFIKDKLITSIEKAIETTASEADLPGKIEAAVEALPKFVQGLLSASGLDTSSLAGQVNGQVSDSARTLASTITETTVYPILQMVMQSLFFLLLFGACMVLVHFVLRLLRGMERLPVVGPLNRLLGGALGLVEAVVIVFVIAVFIKFLLGLTGGFSWLNEEIIGNTYIFKGFYHFNWNTFASFSG